MLVSAEQSPSGPAGPVTAQPRAFQLPAIRRLVTFVTTASKAEWTWPQTEDSTSCVDSQFLQRARIVIIHI